MPTDLAGIKPEQLDFDAIDKAEAKKSEGAKAIGDWPLWMQVSAAWVEMALKTVGIIIDIDPPHPAKYVEDLIALVKASSAIGWSKFLVLSVLTWIHARLKAEPGALKTFAKYAKGAA